MDYKTPGVFVEEISLFPPSVAAVATAIPAFIGYAAQHENGEGESLQNVPVRITSLLEYETLFGGVYEPASYTITLDPAADFSVLDVNPVNNRRYYLYDILRHYFDNGGGPCYIVAVGMYGDPVEYGSTTTGLRGGLAVLEKVDEPTLIAIPDAVSLIDETDAPDFAQIGTLHADIIAQCAKLQDRFGILDMAEGHLPINDAVAPIDEFRNRVGTNDLKYAATYYPWLYSTYTPAVRFDQINFQDDTDTPVPDVTIDTLTGDAALDGLVTSLRSALADEANVFSKVTAVALSRSNYNPLSAQFESLQQAVMDAGNAATARPAFSALMQFVRELGLAFQDLQNDAGIPADLTVALTQLEADTALQAQLVNLIAFEKNAGVMNSIANGRQEADVEAAYAALDSTPWIGGVTVASIAANADDFTDGGGNSVAQTAQAAANAAMLYSGFVAVSEAYATLLDIVFFHTNQAERGLFSTHPFFSALLERIQKEMTRLPNSGAVAGIYATVDRSRGVWKAPANISLRSVVGPTYRLNDREQGDLNVHTTGKSVNAIRAFTGKGILVWGARTLAGNDNEWRYVNVRRFFIMAEESIKNATMPFVFESNDANTWVRIRAMIENFLTLQWRQGALAGATPTDAFFVRVGLGETMTSLDILEGRMIIEVGMAAVRPAEFIILKFSHKMQEA